MKKILGLICITLLIGCKSPKNIDNAKISNFEETYYQRIRSCMYEGNILLTCNFDNDKYFLSINDKTIKFVLPQYDSFRQETYDYTLNNNVIKLEKVDYTGVDKMKYEFLDNILTDGIKITKEIVYDENATEKIIITVTQIYEKIKKEDYIRKTGV